MKDLIENAQISLYRKGASANLVKLNNSDYADFVKGIGDYYSTPSAPSELSEEQYCVFSFNGLTISRALDNDASQLRGKSYIESLDNRLFDLRTLEEIETV